MKLLQAKLAKYDAPQKAKAAGVYPYFRKIESEQDTEVLINGKKVLMFGSNSYLGLTNHPKVIEAAVAATVEGAGFDPYERKVLGVTAMQKHMEPDALVLVSLMAPSTSTLPWKIDWLNSSEKTKPLFTLPVFRLILVLLHV